MVKRSAPGNTNKLRMMTVVLVAFASLACCWLSTWLHESKDAFALLCNLLSASHSSESNSLGPPQLRYQGSTELTSACDTHERLSKKQLTQVKPCAIVHPVAVKHAMGVQPKKHVRTNCTYTRRITMHHRTLPHYRSLAEANWVSLFAWSECWRSLEYEAGNSP